MTIRRPCVSRSADETIDGYAEAADFLNAARFDVVSLQHEYGIFGGEAGGHIVELLKRLDHADRHDAAYRAPGTDAGAAQRHGQDHRQVDQAGRHGREGPRASPVRARRAAAEDRGDPARHSRLSVSRDPPRQGQVRVQRQDRHSHVRPAVAEQRHRDRDRCHAGNHRILPERRLCHSRRDPSQPRSRIRARPIATA